MDSNRCERKQTDFGLEMDWFLWQDRRPLYVLAKLLTSAVCFGIFAESPEPDQSSLNATGNSDISPCSLSPNLDHASPLLLTHPL